MRIIHRRNKKIKETHSESAGLGPRGPSCPPPASLEAWRGDGTVEQPDSRAARECWWTYQVHVSRCCGGPRRRGTSGFHLVASLTLSAAASASSTLHLHHTAERSHVSLKAPLTWSFTDRNRLIKVTTRPPGETSSTHPPPPRPLSRPPPTAGAGHGVVLRIPERLRRR